MFRTSFRLVIQVLGIMTLLVALTGGLAVWQLSRGPLNLDFMTPYIEASLSSKESQFKIKVDATELRWGGWRRNLDLRARGMRAIGPDGRVLASVPEMSLRLSAKALLKGIIAPKTIELMNTRIRLGRDTAGQIEMALGEAGAAKTSQNVTAQLLADLMGPPDPDSPAGYLSRVNIVDAKVSVVDHLLGTHWDASSVNLEFSRDGEAISGQGEIVLAMPEGDASVEVVALYSPKSETLDFGVSFSSVRPSVFSAMLPQLEPIKAIDLPVSGTLALTVDKSGQVESLGFNITGGEGKLRLPNPVAATYAVKSLFLQGQTSHGFENIEVSSAEIDLGGPKVALTADVKGVGAEQMSVSVETTISHVPLNDLPGYWPASIASNAREWIAKNLQGGVVDKANFEIKLVGSGPDDLVVEALRGTAYPAGVTVSYLDTMPKVTDVSAVATFFKDKLVLDIGQGTSEKLTVEEGRLIFTGLNKKDQFLGVDLVVTGDAGDALSLIDNKPFKFASSLGVDPSRTSGESRTRLKLDFPLEHSLKIKDLAVQAQSKITNATIKNTFLGHDLTKGDLALSVDGQGLTVEGTALIAGIAADLAWQESFGNDPVARTFRVKTVMDDAQRKSMGLDFLPLAAPITTGPVAAELEVAIDKNGKGSIGAYVDLTDTKMTIPGFGWDKASGIPASGNFSLRFTDKGVQDIPRFQLTSPQDGLDVSGNVEMNPKNGKVRRVAFERFKFLRNDVAGSLLFKDDGSLGIDVKGKSLDAESFFTLAPNKTLVIETPKEPEINLPPAQVHAEVARVWVTQTGVLTDFLGDVARDGENWHTINIFANIKDSASVQVRVAPFEDKRNFSVTSNDAGAFLKTFGFYNNMEGGALDIQGGIDVNDVSRGTALIRDFKVKDAPVLASLLTVASLTGVFDLMQGEGITFSKLEMPFTYADHIFVAEKAKAFGPALGITVGGHANLDLETFDFSGTLVPSYTLNSMLGHIPLLGKIFVGEEGGGIFGMNYSMHGSVDSPSITVNPLSALTPGFLRNIFGIFDSSENPLEGKLRALEAETATSQPDAKAPPVQ